MLCCAVTHSGMTLAPLVGQLVADEVLGAAGTPAADTSATTTTGTTTAPVSASCPTPPLTGPCGAAAELLAPYRPDRGFDAAVAAAAAAQPWLSWAATLRPGSSKQ